jgi:DNA-binding LacI/PurR family transcriptional regulator
MVSVEDYVTRIEKTCGEERYFIVVFKYNKKEDIIARILEKAKTEKSISGIIFELTFKNVSFRLYKNGKAIFRNFKDETELKKVLSELLI